MKRLINKALLALIFLTIAVAPVSANFSRCSPGDQKAFLCIFENTLRAFARRGAFLGVLGGCVGAKILTWLKDGALGNKLQNDNNENVSNKDSSFLRKIVDYVTPKLGFFLGGLMAIEFGIFSKKLERLFRL